MLNLEIYVFIQYLMSILQDTLFIQIYHPLSSYSPAYL